jgi:hypothetical protein
MPSTQVNALGEVLFGGLLPVTRTVPPGVPLVTHSSEPFTSSKDSKNARPPHGRIPHEMRALESSRCVPASVPSLNQRSRVSREELKSDLLSLLAVKRTPPLNARSIFGDEGNVVALMSSSRTVFGMEPSVFRGSLPWVASAALKITSVPRSIIGQS